MCPEMILGLGSTLGPPGGTGGQVKGGPGGPVFLKSAFLVFLVIFLQTWAKIDARNIPKFFWKVSGIYISSSLKKYHQKYQECRF